MPDDSKRFLLNPVGSAGDVYPFIGLGLALKAQGHHVTILTSGYFEETVRRTGLEFVDILSRNEFLKMANNPKLWSRVQGAGTLLKSMTPALLKKCFIEIESLYEPGRTVLLTPCIGFAARLAHEKLGIPLITIALQPALLWSDHEGPVLDGIWHSAPKWFQRFQYWVAERLLVDPNILPALNGFRKELGLKSIKRITQWWKSPQCVVCLFPEWFAPRQPDWPETIHFSQFPLWNELETEVLPDEVEEFLETGEKPIAFTPGSANMFGSEFFSAAAEACKKLGLRGMLFSKFNEQIPTDLPDGIEHFNYAPFSKLLPKCAAISHHGGIGTTANAMAAGIPQLIMPFTYDQPDNAQRIRKLGLGDFLTRRKYRSELVSNKLHEILNSEDIKNSCQLISDRITTVDPFADACRIAETMIGKDL